MCEPGARRSQPAGRGRATLHLDRRRRARHRARGRRRPRRDSRRARCRCRRRGRRGRRGELGELAEQIARAVPSLRRLRACTTRSTTRARRSSRPSAAAADRLHARSRRRRPRRAAGARRGAHPRHDPRAVGDAEPLLPVARPAPRRRSGCASAGAASPTRPRRHGRARRSRLRAEVGDPDDPRHDARASEVVVLGGHLDSISLARQRRGTRRAPTTTRPGIATLDRDRARAAREATTGRRARSSSSRTPPRRSACAARRRSSRDYQKRGVNVVGVLQLDMTNYQGSDKDIWLMKDFTSAAQNDVPDPADRHLRRCDVGPRRVRLRVLGPRVVVPRRRAGVDAVRVAHEAAQPRDPHARATRSRSAATTRRTRSSSRGSPPRTRSSSARASSVPRAARRLVRSRRRRTPAPAPGS